jgi:hypothetical protein
MSLAALFVIGVLITLTVGAAVALLVYAAILDGRRQRELSGQAAPRDGAMGALFREETTPPPATTTG